jgi:hypothetical protein
MHPQMLREYFKNGDKRYFSVVENLTKIWYLYIKLFNVIKVTFTIVTDK